VKKTVFNVNSIENPINRLPIIGELTKSNPIPLIINVSIGVNITLKRVFSVTKKYLNKILPKAIM